MDDSSVLRVIVADDDRQVHGRIEEQFRDLAGGSVFRRIYCESFATAESKLLELNGSVKVAILDNLFQEGDDNVSHIHELILTASEASPGVAIVVLTEADLELVDAESELGPSTIMRKQGLRVLRKNEFFGDPATLCSALQDAFKELGSEIALADLIRPRNRSNAVLELSGFLKRIEGPWAEVVVRQPPDGSPKKLAIAARYFTEIGLTARNSRFCYFLEWEDGKLSGRVQSLPDSIESLSPDLEGKLNELLEFDWGDD